MRKQASSIDGSWVMHSGASLPKKKIAYDVCRLIHVAFTLSPTLHSPNLHQSISFALRRLPVD
jgi:hypothetical protein